MRIGIRLYLVDEVLNGGGIATEGAASTAAGINAEIKIDNGNKRVFKWWRDFIVGIPEYRWSDE